MIGSHRLFTVAGISSNNPAFIVAQLPVPSWDCSFGYLADTCGRLSPVERKHSFAEFSTKGRICLRRTFSETVAHGHCASHFGLRPARDEISLL